MRTHGLGPLLGICVALTATAGVLTAASAQSRDGGRWEVPRTPDGHPDLQGNWTNVTITPFEREEGLEPVYTQAEVAQLEGRAEARIENAARPSDPNRPAPIAGGSTGGYNNVYIDRGTNIAIVNGEPRTSLVTRPPDGRIPELTPEGRRRAAERRDFRSQFGEYDHPELRPLGERCLVSFGTSAGPPMIPNTFYNNNYTIVQTKDHILILAEMVHDVRVIRFGEPNRLPADVRPWFGDSWGRWEGDTLVVETTNINPSHPFRGVPFSERGRVIERFTRVDEDTIVYDFTIDDPVNYTMPWGGEIPFERFDDLVFEYGCHEGNYALPGILSGARYQENNPDR
jgi:hypothetical protein